MFVTSDSQGKLETSCGFILVNFDSVLLLQYPQGHWSFPKGHVEEGDSNHHSTAQRELEEETGITKTKLIKELDQWLTYDLPKNLLGKIWQGKYRGQKQKWFIMKFEGKDQEINVNTNSPEFLDWKWINPLELPKIVVNFKVDIYKKLLNELNKLI